MLRSRTKLKLSSDTFHPKKYEKIRERFGITTLGIFGSVSRGEDTPDSDVDVLYRFDESRGGLDDLVDLHDYLESL